MTPRIFGLALLMLVAAFSLLGPLATGRDFAQVYPDYVRAAPSLTSHPTPEEARAALDRQAQEHQTETDEQSMIVAATEATAERVRTEVVTPVAITKSSGVSC